MEIQMAASKLQHATANRTFQECTLLCYTENNKLADDCMKNCSAKATSLLNEFGEYHADNYRMLMKQHRQE